MDARGPGDAIVDHQFAIASFGDLNRRHSVHPALILRNLIVVATWHGAVLAARRQMQVSRIDVTKPRHGDKLGCRSHVRIIIVPDPNWRLHRQNELETSASCLLTFAGAFRCTFIPLVRKDLIANHLGLQEVVRVGSTNGQQV